MKKMLVLFIGLGAVTVQAQTEKNDFGSWDTDRDGFINDMEFSTTWDNNGAYMEWDMDDDGFISEKEWTRGTDNHYKKVNGWDKNSNRNFTSWDMDGDNRLDEDEFRQGSYNTWDTDRDGQINNREYRTYNTFGRM